MKIRSKKLLSLLLAVGMITTSLSPAMTAKAEGQKLVGDIQTERYVSGDTSKPGKEYPDDEKSDMDRDTSEFMKISHPELPPNRRDHDPTVGEPGSEENKEAREKHALEVAPDGLIDYLGNGVLSEPSKDGVGDRGQSYSWTGISYGDWMYVSTQFNSAGSTGDIMGRPANPEQADKRFGGDYFTGETDGENPGSTLSKINVKTGETVILMSASKNGLDAQFRASIEYKGKLYFCGSVNHTPSIYEVDPTNDALKCVYRDPSMINYPGKTTEDGKVYPPGVAGAWMEAKGDKNICPAIRGITTFTTPDVEGKKGEEYLVISCVGVDENPYIAVSNDPSSGKFDIIAHAWDEVPTYSKDGFTQEGGVKGELFGYPACHLRDSIFGGSIWEMVQFDGKLYVAMCTGTPATAETHTGSIEDEDGKVIEENHKFIDTMQSFALVCGEYNPEKSITDKDAWKWTPVVGDSRSIEEGGDAAAHPFGIDPERTRAGACNLVVFNDHLYVGEYNDTQIAFINMNDKDFKFLKRNLEQSISYYRMDKDQNFEKVMGSETKKFPTTVEDPEKNNRSGFGQKSSQYIWQSRVFDGKLYFGTFDETMILQPLAKEASQNMGNQGKKVKPEVEKISDVIDEELAKATEADTFDLDTPEIEDKVVEDETTEATEVEKTDSEKATEEVAEEEKTENPAKAEFESLRSVRDDFKAMKANGQVYALGDVDTQHGTVLAPVGTTEREPLVKIESIEDLYLALLVLDDLMASPAKGGITDEITKFSDCVNLQKEITTYAENPENEVPEYMASAVKESTGTSSQQEKYEEMQYIVKNLEGCVAGFDMYSTSDGINFKQITRSGLGDPYNQGLRAFATNEDPNNKWMCVGSANGFWGTSIYRMNTGATEDIVDPAQTRITLKFVNKEGEEVKIDPDKSPQIYVNEGVTTVLPGTIEGLTPVNYKTATPDKAVEIVDGVATIDIVEKALVTINYKEGEKIVKTATAPHTSGNKTVPRRYVEERLPEGYVIVSDAKRFDVNEATSEGVNDFVDIEVKKAFTVTVTDGKADKTTTVAGDTVKITANPAPEGQEFKEWVDVTEAPEGVEYTPVEFADKTSVETTFTMPAANVTIKATYEAPAPKFKITIDGGTASVSEAKKGETVTIKAEVPEDNEFTGWTGEGVEFADATAVETTFEMPEKDVTIKANFKNTVYYVTVEGGEASHKTAKKGETVTITAIIPEEHEFTGWTGEGVEFADATAAETTFTMPEADVKVTANFKEKVYNVTVENGSSDIKTAKKGETVTIKANVPEGKNFAGWTGEGVEFADATAEETTFVMPGKDVNVKANLEVLDGWVEVGADWFYYEEGVKHTGWLNHNGTWYYFNDNGTMKHGEWLRISGPSSHTYYLKDNGAMAIGWEVIEGSWYFFDVTSGERQEGWFVVNGTWYYSNSIGQMQTGWLNLDGSWFFLQSSGAMATGWNLIDGHWYYMNGSGYMQVGWNIIGGQWYYMNTSGQMQVGWNLIGGHWYYMNSSGAMQTGWNLVDGQWYYMNASGQVQVGWNLIGGYWYYMNSAGQMQTGWQLINGTWYFFVADGRMA